MQTVKLRAMTSAVTALVYYVSLGNNCYTPPVRSSLFSEESSKKLFPSITSIVRSSPFALTTKNKTFFSHNGKIIFQQTFSHLLHFLTLPSQPLISFSLSIAMEPKISGKCYKKVAKKNVTPYVVYSEEEVDVAETFINSEAFSRFTHQFCGMGVLSERDFTFYGQDDNLGLPGEIGSIIRGMKQVKLCKQPGAYNISIVKDFYSNLTDPTNKRM